MALRRSSIPLALLIAALCLGASSSARAQAPYTGWELALSGSDTVRAGRPAPVRGTTLHVRGLATLLPEGTALRARFASRLQDDEGAWTTHTSGADGRFVMSVLIPADAGPGDPRLEFEVGPDHRRFSFPVQVRPAESVILYTDRRLYEPGETVHIWGLVRDEATLAPLGDVEVEVALDGDALPPTTHTLRTGASGVFHLTLPTTDHTPLGGMRVDVHAGERRVATSRFAVGTRTYERLLLDVDLGETPVAPGGERDAVVTVHTPDGAPVSGASVQTTVNGQATETMSTDAEGIARVRVRAPRFFGGRVGSVHMNVVVRHPGLGSISGGASLRLAVPQTLEVELIPPHGGLLPEVDEVLFARLHDGYGSPPAAGTRVTLSGAIFDGGEAVGRTDDDGLVELPVRVPRGATMRGQTGADEAPVQVRVDGPLQRRTRAAVRVLQSSDVAPVVDRLVVAPGEPLTVTVLRRPRFEGDIVVELLADGRPLDVRWLPASGRRSTERVVFAAPPHLGLLRVRARPVLGDESLEGTGATTAFVVRPSSPAAPRLDPDTTRVAVGETARLTLHTTPGRRGYAALSVRDLSAHGGERPFRERFLADRFEQALLRTGSPGSRLVRVALASHDTLDALAPQMNPRLDALGLASPESSPDHEGARGVLRDPYPFARVLTRHGIDGAMQAAEEALRHGLARGTLEDVVEGTGPQRRFREDLFRDRDETTLGGAPLTPAHITEAAPGFTFDAVARRVARGRLVSLMLALARFLDPGEEATPRERMAARAPVHRWAPELSAQLGPHTLDDPWGGHFALRETRSPRVVLGARAQNLEWVSPGPDGRFGTGDDVRDPFARVVPRGTAYAAASGEDQLMRAIAVLSVTDGALNAMREAFRRTHPEMAEDRIGDLVSAETSEGTIGLGNLGLVGHGMGGGGGSGYGRGAGRVPRIRSGNASTRVALTAGNLGRLVRQRFPPTLTFLPEIELAADGETTLEIPLADAVTTYLVETIVWREDGWFASARARVEATRDLVVEAPIPTVVHLGDRIELPLRVSNRGDQPRTVRLSLVGDAALGIADVDPTEVTIAPAGAAVVPVQIRPTAIGEGALSVVATELDGDVLDAVRRSLSVRALSRRMEETAEGLTDGELTLALDVPSGAAPRAGGVDLAAGPALLPGGRSGPWQMWPGSGVLGARGGAESLALSIAAGWDEDEVDDSTLSDQVFDLTASLIRLRRGRAQDDIGPSLRRYAAVLLALAPVQQQPGRRPDVADVQTLIERLRDRLAARSVSVVRDPETWVWSAAALSQAGGDPERVRELLRRIEPFVIVIGEDRWVVTEAGRIEPTLLAALAESGVDRRAESFRYLATVGRWTGQGHRLAARATAIGRAVTQRLMAGPAVESVELWIDGEHTRVSLSGGAAHYDAPGLASPGRHLVRVRAGAPVRVGATAHFGLPHRARGAPPGALAVSLEGEVRGLDQTAELTLTLRNQTPRTLPAPRLEVVLPTGAELPAEARQREMRGLGVTVEEDVLEITLPPILPGRSTTVPLPLRWSVAGHLQGLGVTARDRSGGDATVVPPRELHIARQEVTP
ncbi:MAG: MG2 domain-containing protein [Sandaracinaceae bacterium]